MISLEIKIIKNHTLETAIIEYDKHTGTLHITFADQTKKKYSSPSVFHSFGLLRKDFNDIKFLCKGSKINVFHSSYTRLSGIALHESTLGDPNEKLVRIFDYEENNLTNDIQEQAEFHAKWENSFQPDHPMPSPVNPLGKVRTKSVKAIIDGQKVGMEVKYDSTRMMLGFSEANHFKTIYRGEDIYRCFAKMRADFPHIIFLCKGAKINVRPSSMASQMAAGLVAYELTLGKRATNEDIVHIFDYEEHNLTNDPQEQESFYKEWLISIGAWDYKKLNEPQP